MSHSFRFRTARVGGLLLATSAFLSGQQQWIVAAEQAEPTVASTLVENPSVESPGTKQKSNAAGVSSNVAEILKLMDAGVSKDIIKTFVENRPMVRRPGAADLIALKERGVPDEITAALMKRGVESSNEEANQTVAAPAIVNYLSSAGQLDPDSYDFFFYHYAYPRALSYSYDRLARYQPAYYSYPGVVSSPYGVPYYGLSDRYRVARSPYTPLRINSLTASGASRTRGGALSSRRSNARLTSRSR